MENTVWQEWHDTVNVAIERTVAFINIQKRVKYGADIAMWEIAAKQAAGTNQPIPLKPPREREVIAVEYDAGMYTGLLYINTNGPLVPELITQYEKDRDKPPAASGNAVVGEYLFKDLDGSVYYSAGQGDTAVIGQEATAADGTKVKATMVPFRPFGRVRGYVKVA